MFLGMLKGRDGLVRNMKMKVMKLKLPRAHQMLTALTMTQLFTVLDTKG